MMEGDTNQTNFDLNVYFVVPSQYESEKDCNEDMLDAYNKCPDWDVTPEWISEKECMKMKPGKKDVFIIEIFAGETFKKLQEFKCTIIGPRCLLSCFLTGEPIPEGSTPIFNTAMRGIVVSASGFDAASKSEIQERVEYMGGIFTRQLRASVTHLVTDTVISAKYERAVELGLQIFTVEWIKSVWNTNLKRSIPASDKLFDKFKCPVFLNLIVTSTNLPRQKKEEVKRLINNHGGEFMGVLDGAKIKLVITLETSKLSDKLKYAMQNNIPCLKVEWIYESIEAGYSLPITNYRITSTQASSTPEKSAVNEPLNFSAISVIPGDNPNFVDETLASSSTMSSTMSSTLSRESVALVPKATYITVLNRLNIVEAKKAGPFLDGCNIYLTGFSSNYRDKLNRILNVGSATRLDEISEALTHVIVGDATKAAQDLRIIKSKGLYPYILKVEWLEECMKIHAPASEDNYLFIGQDTAQLATTEPPSPLSKKNLQLLQRPKVPAAPLFDDSNFMRKPENDEASEIVQQYLQNSTSEPDNSLREILKLPSTENFENNYNLTKNQSISERWNDTTKKDNRISMNSDRDDSAIPISQDSTISQKLFKGLVFIISGFENEELIQIVSQIQELGGKIVDLKYSGIPDYGIVPLFDIELIYTVGEIVTNLFVEDCIDNEKLVNIEYYHRPIRIRQNIKPLTNCVIGMSTYAGVERRYLSELSEALGARYQDTFARKTNLQKKTYSSTHLICPMPQGEKYNAAVKWKIPAVTADWLIQCATKLKLVNESEYLVGETMAPERSNVTITNDVSNNDTALMGPPNELILKQHTLSKSDTNGDGMKTPVINKRLNLINDKTPQSPFHISTPETPYGQLFKDNPSPRTRKGWVKWIDNFPDIPIEEPPPKRRRSTPMSEVKRKAWDYVAGRFDPGETNEIKDVSENEKNTVVELNGVDDTQSSHIITNRKLSFSDENSPNKTPNNKTVKLQLEQLDNLLKEASNTPEARQSLSTDRAKPYLESNHQGVRCLAKESQPDSVGWEDPVKRVPPQRRSTLNEESINLANEDDLEDTPLATRQVILKPKFMFSGIKEKVTVEKLIKELGGEVSTLSSFDETATHLLCLKPARNEKVLGSIASGKWVLHYRYVEACRDEKKFVDEEEFELGNPKSKGKIPDPSSENEKMIMSAAYRWRSKLLKDSGGAFHGMVALLIVPQEKREQYERLIHAGGGIVVQAKPPYDSSPKSKKITHCFVQLKQIDQKVEWATMANKGIMCFPPQYLNDALMSENPLNPRECVLPDFQKYLALLPK